MNASPFPILGPNIPRLLGRTRLIKQLRDRLTKPSPDHVSVVGPRHYGKTVLLKHLADECAVEKGAYLTSVYWDLRHNTPTSHGAFLIGLAGALKTALAAAGHPGLAGDMSLTESSVYDTLEFVRDELRASGHRVLVIMDGFDHVLANDNISRQTWDAMRTLSQGSGFVLVTGSRRPLRELCCTQESATSDFWEVFHLQPLRVGRFRQEDDWEELARPFRDRGIEVDGSATTELFNWSGGIPTLMMLLLDQLYAAVADGTALRKTDVDRVAEAVAVEYRDVIAPLWEACDEDIKAAYLELVNQRQVRSSDMRSRKGELLERGLVREEGSLLKVSARLVENHAKEQSSSLATLRHLFGDRSRYVANVKGLLELRLKQVPTVDNNLHSMIGKAIGFMSDATISLSLARGIATCAFNLIWKEEAPGGVVPEHWAIADKATGEPLPSGGGAAVNLLRQITGTSSTPPRTRRITKRTYVLLSFLHSAGDHGQHLPPGEGTEAYVVAYCLAAIELAESLALDLVPTLEGSHS